MRKLYAFLFFNLFALFASSVSYSQNADLSVSMTINNPTPYIGSNVVFTITASNNGPNNATGVIVNAILPSGYVYVSSTPQIGNYSVATGIWAIGNLASGATGTLTIITTVLETGVHNFTACITGNETDLISSNNCSSVNSNVISCINNPTISLSNPNCSSTTQSITFSNLPSTGTWTIQLAGANYQGTGTTYTINSLNYGTYTAIITNNQGCSVNLTVNIQQNNNITASAVATYVDYNNDGFVNVGDVVNYQYAVANIGTCTISNVQIANTNNFLILTGTTINTLGVGETNNTSLTATHVITQNEINAGNVHLDNGIFGTNYGIDVILNTSLNITDGIKLNAFIDTNGNGIQDGSEQNYPQANFNYQLNSGINNTVSSSTGNYYLYETNPSNLYNISCSLNSPYTSCGSQYTLTTSSYNNISVNVGSGITTLNFPITVVACTDISVNIYSASNAVPGFNYYNNIYYKNNGTQTIPSGTITFTKDNAVSLISVSPSATTTTSNGFTYNFTNLLPNEGRYIYINMLVPTIPTVSLGQLVTNFVSITPPSGDINSLNNSSTLVRTIVGSYDPNVKNENHGGKILHSIFTDNDFLTYTINFENTGTANAINIKVSDVLDTKLDETTIKMVDASATYVLKRIGNNLTWTFSGINLPPSNPNSSTIGHGHITFQIKPKFGYAVGDIIPNTANIYFDFNPAIVTNNCTTEFVATLENEKFAFNNLNYFPNPVKNSLTISNASAIDEVEITSVLVQKMISKKVNDLQTEINLSELANGVYFVKVTSNGQEKTIKIVKE